MPRKGKKGAVRLTKVKYTGECSYEKCNSDQFVTLDVESEHAPKFPAFFDKACLLCGTTVHYTRSRPSPVKLAKRSVCK